MLTFPKIGDSRISLAFLKELAGKVGRLSNLKFSKAFRVSNDISGTYVDLAPDVAVIPYEEFGIQSITGAAITVYGGQIVMGNVHILVSETTVNISEATDVIGWKYSYGTGSLIITLLGSAWTTDSAYVICPLWNCAFSGSTASIVSKASRMIYPANLGSP